MSKNNHIYFVYYNGGTKQERVQILEFVLIAVSRKFQ